MDVREKFYRDTILKFLPDRNASVLVCGAGPFDKSVFASLGFSKVTISNLDTRMNADQYVPYPWAYEDAQQLSYADNTFDYVVIHAAIHHAASPHRVVTEMYRVARIGLLAIESRDSFVMRFLERWNLTQTYEHAAVFYNGGAYGGVNNSDIPNFIYRWTEREVEKTIKTYAPYGIPRFGYAYATALPVSPQLEKNGLLKYILLKILQPGFWLFTKLFPRQQNLFGFFVQKPKLPEQLFPWLKDTGGGKFGFNEVWGNEFYNAQKKTGRATH